MPAGFRRHLVDKTLINVFHSDTAEIRFVGELVVIQTFSQTMQRIECNSLIKQHDTSLPLNSTHDAMLCRQNGDRIVTDRRFCDVTSPLCTGIARFCCTGWSKKADTRFIFAITSANEHRF